MAFTDWNKASLIRVEPVEWARGKRRYEVNAVLTDGRAGTVSRFRSLRPAVEFSATISAIASEKHGRPVSLQLVDPDSGDRVNLRALLEASDERDVYEAVVSSSVGDAIVEARSRLGRR